MKKFICIIMSAAILLSFAGCGKGNTSSQADTLDLEYYASLGKIPECQYSLGDGTEKVRSELTASEESEAVPYTVTEGEKSVLIDNGTYMYYYMKENEENGISYIVNLGTAYGFEIGTVSIEIKNAMPELDGKEEALTDKNAFFLNGITDGSVLRYTFDNYNVLFVFQDNALCATALYNSDNWTL